MAKLVESQNMKNPSLGELRSLFQINQMSKEENQRKNLTSNNFASHLSALWNFHGQTTYYATSTYFPWYGKRESYAHIKEFEEVCNTFQEGGASIDLMRLKLFPFTLKDKAKIWLNSLRPRSIRTWTDLQAEFLKKFFPTHRTNGLKRQISNFDCT